jgi:hypothetical protein
MRPARERRLRRRVGLAAGESCWLDVPIGQPPDATGLPQKGASARSLRSTPIAVKGATQRRVRASRAAIHSRARQPSVSRSAAARTAARSRSRTPGSGASVLASRPTSTTGAAASCAARDTSFAAAFSYRGSAASASTRAIANASPSWIPLELSSDREDERGVARAERATESRPRRPLRCHEHMFNI